MEKYCTKCGKQLAEEDYFCAICGARVSDTVNSEKNVQSNKNRKKTIILFSMIATVIVLISIILFFAKAKPQNSLPTSNDSSSETTNTNLKEDNIVSKAQGLSSEPEIATKYIEFIKRGFGGCGDVNFAKYYIYDVDKDGCEELIIKTGTCEADATIWFCKYASGEVKKIGSVIGGHSSLRGSTKENSVIIHYGHQGVEWIDSAQIKNNTLNVTEIVAEREVENYTELDDWFRIESYYINDMAPLINYGGVDEFGSQKSIDINFRTIHTSVSDFLEDYSYSGGHYLSNWETSYFSTEDSTIYNLQLTGAETNYFLPQRQMIITARDDIIVGISESGFSLSDIDNTYQLLKWLGDNGQKLIEYEPEIIFKDRWSAYLKWEVNNGYMVIYTHWHQGLTDWKKSRPDNYCFFVK